jgi:signal transduction histidine kinase
VVQRLLFASGVGLLLFSYRYLDVIATGGHKSFLDPLVCELTSTWSIALLFPLLRATARRFPLDQPGVLRRLPAHGLAVVAFGATTTSMMWGSRRLLFPLVGLGPFEYGRMPYRYFMEFPVQIMAYGLIVSAVYAADHYRAEREKRERTARLEAQLSQTRLQNLELQLQPHFLFNALNTISSTMYDDPRAADEMVSHLAELLRRSLRREQGQEVTLRQELSDLEHYLSLVRARFGDDLRVTVEAPPETLDLLVPSLLLQPLVENAVHHGRASQDGAGHIEIRARREPAHLALEVLDDGRGQPATGSENGSGLGLSLTRERLQLLYAGDHGFEAGPRPEGGYEVALRLPARDAPPELKARP